jgi:N-acetylmuramate 1-kinase
MTKLNEKLAQNFLTKNGIADYKISKVAGDASFRSYYRIHTSAGSHILMFAPPPHEDIRPFSRVAEFLVEQDFSAPKIIAQDEEIGFLLLEDFGDDTYSRVLERDISQEFVLYKAACDCLLDLHSKPVLKDTQQYNHALLFREVMLLIEWYLPLQKRSISKEDVATFKHLWFQVFDQLSQSKSLRNHLQKNEDPVLVLRDYHADNLMVLPKRNGIKKVGLLDFQDAVLGSRAYDLVSLLEDARRDLSEENRARIFNHYLQNSACNEEDFKNDYEILSLQRNVKILGIFARLSLRDGKHHYLSFMPRVLNFVMLRLESENPILAEINHFLKKYLTPESDQKNKASENSNEKPSGSLKHPSAEVLENLQAIAEVFQKIEAETAAIADQIFDYLINATDEQIITGNVPDHEDKRINGYVKILNRLFLFSRNAGGLRIINRNTVSNLDKKTYTICMCHDGGLSLDILCDIVNTENQARTPNPSPVRVTVVQAFAENNQNKTR